ncbi:MAG: ribonuclease P protein component [Candidatus Limnocylindrus sp.]|jgi:ribonuclease P protein component
MIRTAADFTALAAAPGVNSPLLGIRFVVRETSDPTLRIGIAAGKKIGGAVVRNRIRRRLKAIARDLAPSVKPGTDLLIGVRAPASVASSAQLRAALTECLRRGKLLTTSATEARA